MHPLKRRFLWLFAPALLTAVACTQLFLVRAHNLTPWKGGGFGMFSTLDSPAARTLRAYLLTSEGEALVVLPEVGLHSQRLLNMPNASFVSEAARIIASSEWLVYAYDDFASLDGLTPPMQRQLSRAERNARRAGADSAAAKPASNPALVAFRESERPSTIDGKQAAVLGVRIEIWRMLYVAQESQIKSELISSTTFPRS